MSVLLSDNFAGMALYEAVASRVPNNALGGSGSTPWAVTSGGCISDGAGSVIAQTASSWNLIERAGGKVGRILMDPTAAASNCAFYGLHSAPGATQNGMLLLLAGDHTSLRCSSFSAGSRTDHQSASITPPGAPFWLELELDQATNTMTVRLLNDDLSPRNELSYTFPGTMPIGGDFWGFGFFQGGDVGKFDNFILEDGGGDTTKPVLSAPAVAAVSSTSATGGVNTTEAGPAWAVITNSATKPTATQTKLGQDHTGSPALAADSALLAAGANPSAFLFTGLDPASTGLYEHITQDDEADPPNTADVVTAGPFSTPAAPVRCTLTLTTDGSAIAANMTGLSWCWWDSAAPDLSLAPKASGTGATTNASGVFDVALPGSTLTTGQTGRLLVYSGNGVAGDVSNKAFCGPVVVS